MTAKEHSYYVLLLTKCLLIYYLLRSTMYYVLPTYYLCTRYYVLLRYLGAPYTEKNSSFLLDFFQKIHPILLEIFIECNILEISGFLD